MGMNSIERPNWQDGQPIEQPSTLPPAPRDDRGRIVRQDWTDGGPPESKAEPAPGALSPDERDEKGRIVRQDWPIAEPTETQAPEAPYVDGKQVSKSVEAQHQAPALEELDADVQAYFDDQEGVTRAWAFVNDLSQDLTGSEVNRIDRVLQEHRDLASAFYRFAGHGVRGRKLLEAIQDDVDVSETALEAMADTLESLSPAAIEAILK